MQALYWLTTWGFTDAAVEVHWRHQMLLPRVRELEAALAWRPFALGSGQRSGLPRAGPAGGLAALQRSCPMIDLPLPLPEGSATGYDPATRTVLRDFKREQVIQAVLLERARCLAGLGEIRDWLDHTQEAPRWQVHALLGALERALQMQEGPDSCEPGPTANRRGDQGAARITGAS